MYSPGRSSIHPNDAGTWHRAASNCQPLGAQSAETHVRSDPRKTWLAVWCRRDRMQTPRQHVRVLAVTCGDNGGLRTEILYNEKHKSELLL